MDDIPNVLETPRSPWLVQHDLCSEATRRRSRMRLRLETAQKVCWSLIKKTHQKWGVNTVNHQKKSKKWKMFGISYGLLRVARYYNILHVCLLGGSRVIENGAEGFCPQKFCLLSVKKQTKTLEVSSRSNCRVVLWFLCPKSRCRSLVTSIRRPVDFLKVGGPQIQNWSWLFGCGSWIWIASVPWSTF